MTGMSESSKLSKVLPCLLDICSDAGREILVVYETRFDVVNKGDSSPLTIADKRSHEIITAGLGKITFDGRVLPVLSEEGRETLYEERKKWDFFWLVDPLDGTKEFIKRNGEFTINIALINIDKPVLGIIYVPVQDVFYFGVQGVGSHKMKGSKNIKLEVNTIPEMAEKLPLKSEKRGFTVIGSRSHMSSETEKFIEKLREKYGGIDIISAGSSLKFCLVAEGKADVYPRFAPTMEWDTAAGQAIVEAMGGSVTEANTTIPLRYNKDNLLNPYFLATCIKSSV